MSAEVGTDADGLEVVHDTGAADEPPWLVADEATDPGVDLPTRRARRQSAEQGEGPAVAGRPTIPTPPDADPPGTTGGAVDVPTAADVGPAPDPGTRGDGPGPAGGASEVAATAGVSGVVEKQMRHLAYLAGAAVVVALVAFFVLANTGVGADLSFTWPTLLLGAFGATVNTARRVMRLGAEPIERQQAVPERLALLQLWLSPIIGATFAGLLYSMFLAGIIQGEFFPAFACASEPYTDYGSFSSCAPTTNADAAMLIVWGFAAGFAERWVPNLLDRFIGDDGEDT